MRQAQLVDGTPVEWPDYITVSAGTHWPIAKADLMRRGIVIRQDVPITAGSVTVDRFAVHRTRISGIEIPNPPTEVLALRTDPEAPLYELRIWGGLKYPGYQGPAVELEEVVTSDGQTVTVGGDPVMVSTGSVYAGTVPAADWWVPLATCTIWSVSVDADGVAVVDGWDRSKLVARSKIQTAYTFSAGDPLEERLATMLGHAVPWLPAGVWQGAAHVAPAVVHEAGSDPWQIITDHAAAVGYVAYVDSFGVFQWRAEPAVAEANVVRTVDRVLVGVDVGYAIEEDPTEVTVVGANPAADPVTATSTNPYSTVGTIKTVEVDQLVANQDDADAAAAAKQSTLSAHRTLRYETVPNVLVEPGDAERLVYPRLGLDEVVIVDTQTITLGTGGAQRHESRTKLL